MDVAVMGATGFVGSHLVRFLVSQGHRVRAVSRRGEGRPGWGESVSAHAANVETGEGLDEAIAGAQGVVHLVAIPRESGGRRRLRRRRSIGSRVTATSPRPSCSHARPSPRLPTILG